MLSALVFRPERQSNQAGEKVQSWAARAPERVRRRRRRRRWRREELRSENENRKQLSFFPGRALYIRRGGD